MLRRRWPRMRPRPGGIRLDRAAVQHGPVHAPAGGLGVGAQGPRGLKIPLMPHIGRLAAGSSPPGPGGARRTRPRREPL